jgi:hypothetical protein
MIDLLGTPAKLARIAEEIKGESGLKSETGDVIKSHVNRQR